MTRYITMLAAAALLLAACDDSGPSGPGETPVARVELDAGAIALDVGQTLHVTARAYAPDGSELANRPVSWRTSHETVATVSAAGVLAAVAPGATWLVATAGGRSDSAAVSVPMPSPPPAPVARVVATTGGFASVMIGATTQLNVRMFAADDTELFDRPVTWSSSSPAVASVDANGLVLAREFGTATVTATVEGESAQVAIDVRSPVEQVFVTASAPGVAVGDEVQATAFLRGANGVPVQRPVTWTSSNPQVAQVDASGKVTARAGGSALIIATSDEQQGWIEVRVGEWSSRMLQTVGESALPAGLWTTQDANGTATTVTALGGSLRLAMIQANSGRFELRFDVLLSTGGSPPSMGSYVFGGTYHYHAGTGTLSLVGYSGETLVADLLPGGGVRVTGRLEPGRAVQSFVYAPLQ